MWNLVCGAELPDCSMVFQPFYGQTANIFGRRWLMISAIVLFIVGSAIGGAAQDMSMLIVGRAVQVSH
jgi:MFS family permease